MAEPVSLEKLTAEVCGVMFDSAVLINKATGDVIEYGESWDLDPEEHEQYEDPAWLHVPFPDEDSDWRIMRDFAVEQEAPRVRDRLWNELNGPHPFRNFRTALRVLDLMDAWYPFYERGMQERLRSWLEVEGIPWTS